VTVRIAIKEIIRPLELPYPTVTANHMYTHTARGVRLSDKAASYRDEVIVLARQHGRPSAVATTPITHAIFGGKATLIERTIPGNALELNIAIYPPDGRRRDIDNVVKLLQDALAAAWDFDDARIALLTVARHKLTLTHPHGAILVILRQLRDE
jgi:Holliday junction resolvase RusA-like endonuclease